MKVSRPPHVIIDVSRRFAVYSDEFIAVPDRQIGIAGEPTEKNLLKALALYVNSEFAYYYEFFHTAQMGVQRSISNLETLKTLPIPNFSEKRVKTWAELYDQLATTENFSDTVFKQDVALQPRRKALETQANELVYEALGLAPEERMLVHDLVHERRKLIQGKVSQQLLQAPSEAEIHAYIKTLKQQLDDFLGDEDGEQHAISVIYHAPAAMLEIRIVAASLTDTLAIREAGQPLAREFSKLQRRLLRQHSQWLYFERNLTVFEGKFTYLFKPLERLHWLPSQALNDAANLIVATLNAKPTS